MIIVPTHKRQKSPFKHSKTIYIFTYGRVIVSVQIHSRKKILKGVKMTTAKWTINTGVQQDLGYHVARFMKRDVCRCGGGYALTLHPWRQIYLCR